MEMETPTISNVAYGNSTNTITDFVHPTRADVVTRDFVPGLEPQILYQPWPELILKEEIMSNTKRRLVKIFIADPDENVPVENCMLYSGEEILTEFTDQELFFEIPIKELLDSHNEMREKTEKETNKDKVEYLKKVRIRDLCMTVVTIAEF